MSQPTRTVLLTVALALTARAAAPPDLPGPALEADLQALRQAGVADDGPALLAHLRARTLSPADRARIARHVRALGADAFAEREHAAQALRKIGPPALPKLRAAHDSSKDLELRLRARQCV